MTLIQPDKPMRRFPRLGVLALAALLPVACAEPPPPANPFLGTWGNADVGRLTFQDTTLIINPPGGPQTLGPNTCGGRFRFGYSRKTRDALTATLAAQPDLRNRLGKMLTAGDYQVADLNCDNGNNTYVLLNDRDVIAIYRDGDVGNIERLQRL